MSHLREIASLQLLATVKVCQSKNKDVLQAIEGHRLYPDLYDTISDYSSASSSQQNKTSGNTVRLLAAYSSYRDALACEEFPIYAILAGQCEWMVLYAKTNSPPLSILRRCATAAVEVACISCMQTCMDFCERGERERGGGGGDVVYSSSCMALDLLMDLYVKKDKSCKRLFNWIYGHLANMKGSYVRRQLMEYIELEMDDVFHAMIPIPEIMYHASRNDLICGVACIYGKDDYIECMITLGHLPESFTYSIALAKGEETTLDLVHGCCERTPSSRVLLNCICIKRHPDDRSIRWCMTRDLIDFTDRYVLTCAIVRQSTLLMERLVRDGLVITSCRLLHMSLRGNLPILKFLLNYSFTWDPTYFVKEIFNHLVSYGDEMCSHRRDSIMEVRSWITETYLEPLATREEGDRSPFTFHRLDY